MSKPKHKPLIWEVEKCLILKNLKNIVSYTSNILDGFEKDLQALNFHRKSKAE